MSLNASRNGRFEELALPVVAHAKNLGIIAMKVPGQEFLLGSGSGKASMDSLLRYSLSLPVTTAVVGMPQFGMLEQNTSLAKNFSPLSGEEINRLRLEELLLWNVATELSPRSSRAARNHLDHLVQDRSDGGC